MAPPTTSPDADCDDNLSVMIAVVTISIHHHATIPSNNKPHPSSSLPPLSLFPDPSGNGIMGGKKSHHNYHHHPPANHGGSG